MNVFALDSELGMDVWLSELKILRDGHQISSQSSYYLLGFSRVVTGILSSPGSRCIFAEYTRACNKYEGYLAIKFP